MRIHEVTRPGLQLLDHQLVDSEGNLCGNVDDLRFDCGDGPPRLTHLLSGPGTWPDRLPRPLRRLARLLLFDRVVAIPLADVDQVDGAVRLRRPARELGIGRGEARAARWLARLPGSGPRS